MIKIRNLNVSDFEILNKVPVHNIGEERSAGFFNNELNIRDKKNVEAASRKMILNKSRCKFNQKFSKQTNEIKTIKLDWNDGVAK